MTDDTRDDGQAVDAAFLDVDEADVETSVTDENAPHAPGNAHETVEPGTDDEDTTVSRLTDALDGEAIAASGPSDSDTAGSDR